MNFSEQIKKLRKDRGLTQQGMADQLGISRQAISNWENDKNLPDIEMLILMSQVFHITLDELILGGTNMNNMTEKLIQDGSDTARMRLNLLGIKIGSGLLALGFLSLIAGIWVPYSLEGYCGAGFTTMTFCGVLTFLVVGMKNLADLFQDRNQKNTKWMAGGGLLVLAGILLYAVSLLTEMVSSYFGFMAMIAGIALLVAGGVMAKQEKE